MTPSTIGRNGSRILAAALFAGLLLIGIGPAAAETVAEWSMRTSNHIRRFVRQPVEAKTLKQDRRVELRFLIDGQGNVSQVAIAKGSGIKALDRAALDAVAKANPVPAPPPDRPQEIVKTVLPIRFAVGSGRRGKSGRSRSVRSICRGC